MGGNFREIYVKKQIKQTKGLTAGSAAPLPPHYPEERAAEEQGEGGGAYIGGGHGENETPEPEDAVQNIQRRNVKQQLPPHAHQSRFQRLPQGLKGGHQRYLYAQKEQSGDKGANHRRAGRYRRFVVDKNTDKEIAEKEEGQTAGGAQYC